MNHRPAAKFSGANLGLFPTAAPRGCGAARLPPPCCSRGAPTGPFLAADAPMVMLPEPLTPCSSREGEARSAPGPGPGPVPSRRHPDPIFPERSGAGWGRLPAYTRLFGRQFAASSLRRGSGAIDVIAWKLSGAGGDQGSAPPSSVIRGLCRSPGARQRLQPPGLLRAPGRYGLRTSRAPSPRQGCEGGEVAQRTGRGRAGKASTSGEGEEEGFGEGRCFIPRG